MMRHNVTLLGIIRLIDSFREDIFKVKSHQGF